MQSELFDQTNLENQSQQRFALQNTQLLRVSLGPDVLAVKGVGIMAGGLFNTTVSGQGTVALCTVGKPVVLDCASQPTYVDVQAAVAWSANLVPSLVNSMKFSSVIRGGSGEAFQYAFHGPGFVVVQPSEWTPPTHNTGGGGGGVIGNLLNG